MALAEYFNKNQQAASLLLKGIDPELFQSVLEKVVIGIAFDAAAVSTAQGRAAIDLTIRLAARLYPTLSFVALDDKAMSYAATCTTLAQAVNPAIELLCDSKRITHGIVIGNTAFLSTKHRRVPVFYIGSDNWVAKFSASSPTHCGKSPNPFGAGAAACIGAANIFRSVFAAQLPGSRPDGDVTFSVLDLDMYVAKPKNPPWKTIDVGEMHLVGAGAVGNGFLWAVLRSNFAGQLHVVDAETLALSNLQRYVCTITGDVGQPKTDLARAWNTGKKLTIHDHAATWETYVAARGNWSFERIAVAVDSAQARIEIQASLPKKIFNSWTQAGEVGLSRHDFVGPMACLACLYIPRTRRPNFDQIVLDAFKLPPELLMDVRRRLDTNAPTERDFLDVIANVSGVAIDRLQPYEGKPLRELYIEAICGGAVLEFASGEHKAATDVPMAFQSALAGILLAADVVADVARLRPPLPTVTQIDLLRPLDRKSVV